MKIISIWVGAFGFALLYHLGHTHPKSVFYGYEKNPDITKTLRSTWEHPYFFPWVSLPKNITFLDAFESISDFDVVILSVPAQAIAPVVEELKSSLKPWVILLNISKGMDISSKRTPSEIVASTLWDFPYTYAILSWGMIASEVVEWVPLGAQIGCSDTKVGENLRTLFEGRWLEISLTKEVKNIELYGSIKNIISLYIWYIEGGWYGASTLWYILSKLFQELPTLLEVLWWNRACDFWEFALGWDIIATGFWNSRNRYFGTLVWKWNTSPQAEFILQSQNKHAEGYYTLQAIGDEIMWQAHLFPTFVKIVETFRKK